MPTTRPRIMVTETDELAAALDAAAERWPELRSRRELLLALADEGRRHLDAEAALEERRQRILSGAGMLAGVYPPDYLEELRKDWPE